MPTAYIQQKSDGLPFDGIAFAAYEGFVHLGYEIEFFRTEQLFTNPPPFTAETPVVGPMQTIKRAWSLMGVKSPRPPDYPHCLQSYLRRVIGNATLAECSGLPDLMFPLFLKPAQTHKLWTGYLCMTRADLGKVSFADPSTPVYVCPEVEFLCEQRVFVLEGNILHVAHYDGDPFQVADRDTVHEAIEVYEKSGEAPVAYAADFGVIGKNWRRGATALVEVNDAFALGPYTLATSDYADMLAARWYQICNS